MLEGGASLLLSEVAEPPAQMIESLTVLFKEMKTVKRAYLCLLKEHADEPADYLIGIEADGDIEPVINAAGSVATDTLPGDEPVDICRGGRREGHQPLYDGAPDPVLRAPLGQLPSRFQTKPHYLNLSSRGAQCRVFLLVNTLFSVASQILVGPPAGSLC